MMVAKCRSAGITIDCLRDGQALLWNETSLGLVIGSLASRCGLNSFPRIESHDGPVTAEADVPAGIGDTLPDPGAGSALRADIVHPHIKSIGIRIGVQRLHAGDDPELAESWNVGCRDGFNVFNARPVIVFVVPHRSIFVGI